MELTPEILKQIPFHCGPLDAKIAFVAEAPGRDEEADDLKRPFIGASGQLFRSWLRSVDIDPEQCYITNLLKERPPGNNFDKFVRENPETFKTHRALLLAELRLLPNLNLIVPVGGRSFNVLCNKGHWETDKKRGGKSILNNRGSIINCTIDPLKSKKAIPILHPAGIMRKWLDRVPTMADLQRIAGDMHFPEKRLPNREFLLRPTFDQVIEYLNLLLKATEPISVDTETRRGRIITIQLAQDTKTAMCIPLQYSSGKSYFTLEQEIKIWKLLVLVLHTKSIVGQNFLMFDTFVCGIQGFDPWKILNNFYMDTMEAFQCYQPQLPKSLAFLTSLYTREPYYKDEGKDGKKQDAGQIKNETEFWTYGCKDVLVVKDMSPEIEKDLRDCGRWEFYQKKFQARAKMRLKMTFAGLKLDETARKKLNYDTRRKILKYQCELNILVNRAINVKSSPAMQKLLYDDMKLPKQYNKATRKVTCDENAILTLSASHPSKVFDLILKVRHHRTERSNYILVKVDSDGHVRSTYGFTNTGRFTSSKCPIGTGYNLQNWPKDMRIMLIAGIPGWVLLEMDFSQAEARVVAWKSRDEAMIHDFLTGVDRHVKTASNIFLKAMEEINKDLRYTGKRINHAANYGLGPETFAKAYNKDAADNKVDLISVQDAAVLMARHHKANPSIRGTYQKEIAQQLRQTKMLTNCWGRTMIFHDRIGDDLFRAGYGWYAQSTVGDLTNEVFERVQEKVTIVNQGHDSLLALCREDEVAATAKTLYDAAQINLRIEEKDLLIPVDFNYGTNWKEMKGLEVAA